MPFPALTTVSYPAQVHFHVFEWHPSHGWIFPVGIRSAIASQLLRGAAPRAGNRYPQSSALVPRLCRQGDSPPVAICYPLLSARAKAHVKSHEPDPIQPGDINVKIYPYCSLACRWRKVFV